MGFERLDVITPQVVEPGGITVHLPFEGKLETNRHPLLQLLLRLLVPFEPGNFDFDQPLFLDRIVTQDNTGTVTMGGDLQDALIQKIRSSVVVRS
jgi:hypothetical protein